MIHKYELSGRGAGQRADDDSDYGRVDIEQCIEDGDRVIFNESDAKETYFCIGGTSWMWMGLYNLLCAF